MQAAIPTRASIRSINNKYNAQAGFTVSLQGKKSTGQETSLCFSHPALIEILLQVTKKYYMIVGNSITIVLEKES
jgi:hypothetical protein